MSKFTYGLVSPPPDPSLVDKQIALNQTDVMKTVHALSNAVDNEIYTNQTQIDFVTNKLATSVDRKISQNNAKIQPIIQHLTGGVDAAIAENNAIIATLPQGLGKMVGVESPVPPGVYPLPHTTPSPATGSETPPVLPPPYPGDCIPSDSPGTYDIWWIPRTTMEPVNVVAGIIWVPTGYSPPLWLSQPQYNVTLGTGDTANLGTVSRIGELNAAINGLTSWNYIGGTACGGPLPPTPAPAPAPAPAPTPAPTPTPAPAPTPEPAPAPGCVCLDPKQLQQLLDAMTGKAANPTYHPLTDAIMGFTTDDENKLEEVYGVAADEAYNLKSPADAIAYYGDLLDGGTLA